MGVGEAAGAGATLTDEGARIGCGRGRRTAPRDLVGDRGECSFFLALVSTLTASMAVSTAALASECGGLAWKGPIELVVAIIRLGGGARQCTPRPLPFA